MTLEKYSAPMFLFSDNILFCIHFGLFLMFCINKPQTKSGTDGLLQAWRHSVECWREKKAFCQRKQVRERFDIHSILSAMMNALIFCQIRHVFRSSIYRVIVLLLKTKE